MRFPRQGAWLPIFQFEGTKQNTKAQPGTIIVRSANRILLPRGMDTIGTISEKIEPPMSGLYRFHYK